MQRQDDYLMTREAMLLFIAQLLSLSAVVFRVVAQCRTIDDRLLHAFVRSELAMQIVLSGLLSNTDTRGTTPGLEDIIEFDEPPDRHAELLRIGASLQQIAMMLALLLAMNPRAFRDRTRTASSRGGHPLSSFRGGAFPPPCGGPKDGRDPWLAPAGGRRSLPGGVASTTPTSSCDVEAGSTLPRFLYLPHPSASPTPSPQEGGTTCAARGPP